MTDSSWPTGLGRADRGQTFTLEAFVAAVLLVTTVLFALQAVTISSNTASGADTELRGQQADLASGLLDQAAAQGTLRTTVVYWNDSAGRFHGTGNASSYISPHPNSTFGNTTLGEALETTFDGRQVQYNINLYYVNASDREVRRLVVSGAPSDDAVRVQETVTLYDNTTLVRANETRRDGVSLETVESAFYAPDEGAGPVYNVVQVEVVLWQL